MWSQYIKDYRGDLRCHTILLQAARARCTVGEISQAMEDVFSRHVATDRMVSGAYKTEYGADQELQACMEKVEVSTLMGEISQAMEDVFSRHG